MNKKKVIIIGSGPAGYSAAIYLSRAGLSPIIISGNTLGGQLTQTTDVENYPGFESVAGLELTNKWKKHAEKFGTEIINSSVIKLEANKTEKLVYLLSGDIIKSDVVLIASGANALWLGLESENRLRGKGVSACATCDGFFFKGKTIAVVGGGDTALEEASFLTRFANKVYLIHRRNELRGSKIMQSRVLNNPKIIVLWESQIEEIIGKEKVTGIRINTTSKEAIEQLSKDNILTIDGVFIAIGHKPSTEFLKNSGVLLDDKGYIITTERLAFEHLKSQITNSKYQINQKSKIPNNKQINNLKIDNWDLFGNWNLELGNYKSATSVEGIFAAGDCADPYYRQAGVAVGSGIIAALEIEKYLEE